MAELNERHREQGVQSQVVQMCSAVYAFGGCLHRSRYDEANQSSNHSGLLVMPDLNANEV